MGDQLGGGGSGPGTDGGSYGDGGEKRIDLRDILGAK